MITERDAEAGRRQRCREHGELEPINAEIPQIQWHCGEREKKRADQERTGRPIDAVRRNAKNQEREPEGRVIGSLTSPVRE